MASAPEEKRGPATPVEPAPAEPGSESRLSHGLLSGLIGFSLKRAQVRVANRFAGALGRFDLTENGFGILVLIAENPGLSQAALGAELGIDRSTMVGSLDRLQKRGLIRREPHPRDRRVHAVFLTEAGFALLMEMRPALEAFEGGIAAALPEGARDLLPTWLNALARTPAPDTSRTSIPIDPESP